MTESEFTAALDVLVDRCDDEHGDWAGVLSRAGLVLDPAGAGGGLTVSPRPRRRTSPRRIGLVALAALLLGVVALVATGFARDALSLLGRIDVDFRSSEPAPDVVRWRFEDLGIGFPRNIGPHAIASQARTVGTIPVNGRERKLWVVPTRGGGFCYELEDSYRSCLPYVGRAGAPSPRTSSRIAASAAVSIDGRPGTPSALRVLGVRGTVLGDEVERLTIEFGGGASEDLDFVYVSPPIDAGFFAYAVPKERQSGLGRPRFVVGRNGAGEVVARQGLSFPHYRPSLPRSPPSRGPTERTHRARPSRPPSAPIQRGEAHGVSITAGSNGSVLFDLRGITPERRAMLENGVNFVCFELVVRRGVPRDRALGYPGNLQPTAGFRFHGIGTPFDGCELYGRYGHRWPDKLDSHNVIEVPFTEAGSRYFEDRAAASDLALFAGSRAMLRLRQHPPPLTADDLRTQFGTRIAALASRAALPPKGMIGYWVDGSNVLLRRVSSTGRRLEIVIGPSGGIQSENIRHLAYVV